ncbi:hypothetical protein M2302_001234 [Micromonospora sp. A200]|nr:hypothetical protein [Micromonospora sp. A200]
MTDEAPGVTAGGLVVFRGGPAFGAEVAGPGVRRRA